MVRKRPVRGSGEVGGRVGWGDTAELTRRWEKGGGGVTGGSSCFWELADVCQVGVIQDGLDALQGVCLADALQLHLK